MTMPDRIKQWRKEQRSELLARRVAVARGQQRTWTEAITASLLEGFPILQSSVVGFYWPFQGEFDPRFAIRRVREAGARAALPVVLQKAAPLQFREWWPGVSTTKGVFNLPVPDGSEVLTPQALLIPPIGFDLHGYRLGYGGGYFDRTLAAMTPQPLKIGVAFELSRMRTIQPQAHDIPMDFIVTEAGIHYVGPAGLELITDRARILELVGAIVAERKHVARAGGHQPCKQDASGPWAARQDRFPSFSRCYARAVEFEDEDE
jgi:5-formyltetrahydrofolate cyclo-ligase